ncbi:hypothetical protein E2C01_088427 [Portunus trituberculatus]|uniref:Uncharacterized protein n=1 Tax=Portunus trituberculatus TaxID=210409 RepID=A0A5B7JFY4_PORTR|nr:hypothetical protein [Portunus trituberculatus]
MADRCGMGVGPGDSRGYPGGRRCL